MSQTHATEFQALVEDFERRTPRSAEHWREASKYEPAGVTKPEHFFRPYPVYLSHGDGAHLYDIDGNEYVDLTYVGTSLPLGHNNPAIRDAITEQLACGTGFSKANVHTAKLARMICERVPSVDKVVFTDSGSKAVYFALRIARAFTGRQKVAKFVGAFHGTHDTMWFGLGQVFDFAEPLGEVAVHPGILEGAASDVVLLPFDDIEACEAIIEANRAELGSVIVEPVLGDGYLPPSPTFLSQLEEICRRHEILLIFDEMITLSLGKSGAQGVYDVTPDLTAMGKPLGAGMPIAAVGGRHDLLALADCSDGSPVVGGLSSTFAGHPLATVAGIAQLEQMTDDVYERLWALGDLARTRINELGAELGAPLQATGVGHFLQVHWHPEPVDGFARHNECDRDVLGRLDQYMFMSGYAVLRNHRIALSLALDERQIEAFIDDLSAGVRLLQAETLEYR